MNGNGWAGSIESGVSTGKMDDRNSCLSQLETLLVIKIARANDQDVFLGQILLQHRKRSLLFELQLADFLQCLVELAQRRAAVGGAAGDALADLALQAGDADHEELVQIGRRNREEADTFQQADGRCSGSPPSTRRLN